MTERSYEPPEADRPADSDENPDLRDLDSSGIDRSADYSVDQKQAHRNAEEGRESTWTASDPG